MTRRLPWYTLPLLALAIACGGGPDGQAPSATSVSPTAAPSAAPAVSRAGNPIKVVVSLPVFADFVREVGGENVQVQSLVPAGTNPHTYEPSEADAEVINAADIVFVNGLGLEGKLSEFIAAHRVRRTPLLATFAANVPSPSVQQPLGGLPIYATEKGDNPHLWLDPTLAKVYPETVSDTLNIVDGANGDYYHDNFMTYWDKLKSADQEAKRKIDAIPARRRKVIVYHDSLVHLARHYGLEVAGVAAPDPRAVPGPGEIDALVSIIKENGVPAVFAEAGFDSAPVVEAANRAGVKVCSLYTDTLDDRVQTYLDALRFNADELARCLGG